MNRILTIIIGLLTIVGMSFGASQYFTPREVTELMIAGVQQNQIQIQKQAQRQNAQQWYQFYQSMVERLTGECGRNPNNEMLQRQLSEAKRMRDEALQEWKRLMNE